MKWTLLGLRVRVFGILSPYNGESKSKEKENDMETRVIWGCTCVRDPRINVDA